MVEKKKKKNKSKSKTGITNQQIVNIILNDRNRARTKKKKKKTKGSSLPPNNPFDNFGGGGYSIPHFQRQFMNQLSLSNRNQPQMFWNQQLQSRLDHGTMNMLEEKDPRLQLGLQSQLLNMQTQLEAIKNKQDISTHHLSGHHGDNLPITGAQQEDKKVKVEEVEELEKWESSDDLEYIENPIKKEEIEEIIVDGSSDDVPSWMNEVNKPTIRERGGIKLEDPRLNGSPAELQEQRLEMWQLNHPEESESVDTKATNGSTIYSDYIESANAPLDSPSIPRGYLSGLNNANISMISDPREINGSFSFLNNKLKQHSLNLEEINTITLRKLIRHSMHAEEISNFDAMNLMKMAKEADGNFETVIPFAEAYQMAVMKRAAEGLQIVG